MSPLRRVYRFIREYLDVLIFAATLATSVPLVGWWAVLVRRNIFSIDVLARKQAAFSSNDAHELTQKLVEIGNKTERQLFMITGEAITAGVLLAVFAGALFVIARRRRSARTHLQQLLQFSTHELKTPVAAVRTLLQSLQRGSIPAEQQERFLAQGIVECNRLEHMAETILAYQHATVLRRPPLEVCNTAELIGDVLEHRGRTFGAEKVKWERGQGLLVRANKDAFRVVFENLLDNARKYGGGQQAEVEERFEGRNWKLYVKDQGIGFEPKDAEALFEPFQRKAPSGVTTHGSGLGLYLARQLARSMKGDLTATSAGPGKGSTFVLELLPAADAKSAVNG